jgi:hypothetical protein
MVELIQLVDESLARHGLGALLQVGRCHETPLDPSLAFRHLPETQDLGDPNWANVLGDPSGDRVSVVMEQSAVVRVTSE